MTGPHDELSAPTAALIVLTFVGALSVGWLWAGAIGALFGGGIAAVMGVFAGSWRRVRRAHRMLEEGVRLPEGDRVPPRQALALMSGLSTTEGGLVSYRSELLARLEEIEAVATRDPKQAVELARELSEDHPRNPAARAALARGLLALGEHEGGIDEASRAIALALDGGMNPAAAAVFEEVARYRDDLRLAPPHLERLARILENREDDSGARWCRDRLGRISSEHP